MPEIKKYNLVEKLKEADKKYAHDPAIFGSSSMTFAPYNNSTRTQMYTAHINQIVNIINPEFPFVFTGAENIVGVHSSGYTKLKNPITVVKKIVKFKELVNRPYVYHLFFWDHLKERYDVRTRTEVKDLGQDYGYLHNNEMIDSLTEGQEVDAGEVLYKSASYDDSMNYRYGRNWNVVYSLEPWTSDDAALIDDEVCREMTSIHSKKIPWGWNDNDVPLNCYGGEKEHRPLPWIGEHITKGYITASRSKINEQVLFDMSHANLQVIHEDRDRVVKYEGHGIIVDYDIYCNNPNIKLKRNSLNAQVLMLLDSQNKYWKEVLDFCTEIRQSGKDYTRAVDLLYKKAMEFLNPDPMLKWNNGSTAFGNLEFRAHVIEYTGLERGGKFTARFGNKSVTAKVVPRHEMPFTKDGRRANIVLNLLAIPNRTTGFVLHELHITWAASNCRRYLKTLNTLKEKEAVLFDFIKRLSNEEYEQTYLRYKQLTKEEKEAYIQSAIDTGIFIHQDMVNEDESIFYKLKRMEEELPYLKSDQMYVYRWGHIYPCKQKHYLGSMYFFPLKQTDKRGFSARATGAINMKGLPERSYKNKRNEASYSDSTIRFGEYEILNFLIGMSPEEITCMEACYRTSPEAGQDLTKAQFVKKRMMEYQPFYKSRTAEIFSVFYKHLGLELEFIDPKNQVKALDNSMIRSHVLNGETYLCTDYEFYLLELRSKLKKAILEEEVVLSEQKLEQLVDEEMKQSISIMGEPSGKNIFGTDEILVDKEE